MLRFWRSQFGSFYQVMCEGDTTLTCYVVDYFVHFYYCGAYLYSVVFISINKIVKLVRSGIVAPIKHTALRSFSARI